MKKTLCIFLSVVLCISALIVPCSAGAAGAKGNAADYPLIIIPGINHSVSYLANDDGTPYVNGDGQEVSGGLLLVDSEGLILKIILTALVPIVAAVVFQNDCGVYNAAYKVSCELFKLQSCNTDGTAKYNLKTYSYDYPMSDYDKETKEWFYRMLPIQKVTDKTGEDNVYLYTFPLVGDPMESGRGLFDYVEMVKRQKNVDRVNLATVSLGGTILTAYASMKEDWSDIGQIINVVSCLNGSDIFADFYAREWNLDADFLYGDYLRGIFAQSTGSEAVGSLINIAVRIFPKKAVYSLLSGFFSGVLDCLFINDAQFWAMMPAQRYDALREKYLSGNEYDTLRTKTDAFQNARLTLCDNLTEAHRQGVLVNNICGSDLTYSDGDYNFLGIVASCAECNSDGIVPVYSASLGATTVPAGTTFSDEYLANADPQYISDLKSIDASTCLFPDNVWFFQRQHHEVGRNDAVMELLSRIATGEITDVHSSPEFPQFMGTRYTKNFTRWLFPEAEGVIANEDGKYTDEQIAQVKQAYDEAYALLSDYSVNDSEQERIDAAEKKLTDILVEIGAKKAAESNNFLKIIEKPLRVVDNVLFFFYRDNGYFEK